MNRLPLLQLQLGGGKSIIQRHARSTSGGKLHLNTSDAASGTSAPGPDINAAVEALFPAEKTAPAPAAKSSAPAAGQQAQSGTKAVTTPDNTDNFSKISAIVLKNEEGYANRASDNGGSTNHGSPGTHGKNMPKKILGLNLL